MAAQPVTPMPSLTPEATPLSEGARILNTFVAPSKTFTDLRRSASWWAPFLLIAISSVAFTYFVDQKIGFRKVSENQIQASPKAAQRLDQMPPDQRNQAIEAQATGTKYFSYGFPIVLLILYVIFAALYLGTFKFGAGADLKYKVALAVVVYTALPQVLKTILAIVSIVAGASPDSFMIQNPVATNPGYFMNPADSPFLFGVASSLDVFAIWSVVLAGIGFSCVTKVKRSTAMLVVFGWYVAIILFFSGLGALAS
jgi:hypothetical protein